MTHDATNTKSAEWLAEYDAFLAAGWDEAAAEELADIGMELKETGQIERETL